MEFLMLHPIASFRSISCLGKWWALPRSSCQQIGRYSWYLFSFIYQYLLLILFTKSALSHSTGLHTRCIPPPTPPGHRLILSQQLLTPLLFLPLRISPHIQSGLYIVKSNPPLLWSLVVASHTLSSLTLTPLDEATLSLPQGAGTRSSFCLKCPSALSFTWVTPAPASGFILNVTSAGQKPSQIPDEEPSSLYCQTPALHLHGTEHSVQTPDLRFSLTDNVTWDSVGLFTW